MKILTGLIIVIFMMASCSNQNISAEKVPSVVVNSLKVKYPVTDEVEWKKVNDLFEAELDLSDSVDATVQIDEAGNILMLKEDIAVNELPAAVTTTIKNNYADYTIDDVEKLEKRGSIYYQVELNAKGKKDVNLVLTEAGMEEKNVSYWD